MSYITAYLASAFVFFGLDLIWLGLVARRFYAGQLVSLMREQPKLGVSALFYVGYVAAIIYFAVQGATSLGQAAMSGLFLGLTAYGTYNVTNMATLKGWPARMSLVDMVWGSSLTSLAAMAGFLAF